MQSETCSSLKMTAAETGQYDSCSWCQLIAGLNWSQCKLWESLLHNWSQHTTLSRLAYLHLRNTLTYLLTYLLISRSSDIGRSDGFPSELVLETVSLTCPCVMRAELWSLSTNRFHVMSVPWTLHLLSEHYQRAATVPTSHPICRPPSEMYSHWRPFDSSWRQ